MNLIKIKERWVNVVARRLTKVIFNDRKQNAQLLNTDHRVASKSPKCGTFSPEVFESLTPCIRMLHASVAPALTGRLI